MSDSSYPRIIAQRSDGALLVALDMRRGCIYRPDLTTVSPSLPLGILLGQPYWEAFTGSQAAQAALQQANERLVIDLDRQRR